MKNNVFIYDYVPYNSQNFFRVFFLLFLCSGCARSFVNLVFVDVKQMSFINKNYKKKCQSLTTLVFLPYFNFKFFFGDIFFCVKSVFHFKLREEQLDFFRKIVHSLLHSCKINHVYTKELTFVIEFEFFYLNFLLKFF